MSLFTNLQNINDRMVKLNISYKLCIQFANKLENCSLLVAFSATCKIISAYKFAIQMPCFMSVFCRSCSKEGEKLKVEWKV